MSRFPCLFLYPSCKGAEDTNRTDLIRSLSSDAIEATGNNVQSLKYAETISPHGSELRVGLFGNTVLVRVVKVASALKPISISTRIPVVLCLWISYEEQLL